jgi:hypothetical protein
MKSMIDEINDYFMKIPREEILKSWDKTSKYDLVGPTIEEFINGPKETVANLKAKLKKELPHGKYTIDGCTVSRDVAINYVIDSEVKGIPIKVQYGI